MSNSSISSVSPPSRVATSTPQPQMGKGEEASVSLGHSPQGGVMTSAPSSATPLHNHSPISQPEKLIPAADLAMGGKINEEISLEEEAEEFQLENVEREIRDSNKKTYTKSKKQTETLKTESDMNHKQRLKDVDKLLDELDEDVQDYKFLLSAFYDSLSEDILEGDLEELRLLVKELTNLPKDQRDSRLESFVQNLSTSHQNAPPQTAKPEVRVKRAVSSA